MSQLIKQPKSRIAIVGEAWGEHEEARRMPFVGPSGYELNRMLALAGIDRNECLVTNVFNMRPAGNNIEAICGPKSTGAPDWPALIRGKYVRAEYMHHVRRMQKEIDAFNPNVILALGNTPLWALTKRTGIKNYRGAISMSGTRKVVPTYHPAAVMREWKLRPIAIADMKKAAAHSTFPEYHRPSRELWLEPAISDLYRFYDQYIEPSNLVAADIETPFGQISEISFAPDPNHCLVIPFYCKARPNYWPTLDEEIEAWKFVRYVCETKPLAGQNFMFDMQHLWQEVRIPCPGLDHDSMLLHHALQPEMEKSLGFLGSIYCDEQSWKFMRTEQLKRED